MQHSGGSRNSQTQRKSVGTARLIVHVYTTQMRDLLGITKVQGTHLAFPRVSIKMPYRLLGGEPCPWQKELEMLSKCYAHGRSLRRFPNDTFLRYPLPAIGP